MPQKTYEITAPNGKVFEIQGDRMPTESELRQIFATMGADKGAEPRTVRQPGAATMGEVLQSKPEGSASWRFASNLGEVLNPVAMVKGAYQAVTSPIDTAKGIVGAQAEQFGKAKTAYDEGRYSEMFGHGAASLLPILGPQAAQAGEQIGAGDVAGGMGRATGILTPFAVKGAMDYRRAPSARTATKADRLEREAVDQVSKGVLSPANPRYRAPARQIAPELLKRGVRGDRIELQQWADNLIGDASQQIDQVWDNLPPTYRTATAPILKRLDDELEAMRFDGPPRNNLRVPTREVNPVLQGRYDELAKLRKFVADRGASLSADDVRTLRQQFDEAAVEHGALMKTSGDAKVGASGKASLSTANAFRQQIASDLPELVQANADMHLGLTLKDILDPTKGRPSTQVAQTGVTGGLSTAGAIIGSQIPGMKALGAFLVSDLLPRIRNAQLSPANQLRLAQDKFKLAQAMRQGNQGMAQKIALNMSVYLPKGEQATRLAESRTPAP